MRRLQSFMIFALGAIAGVCGSLLLGAPLHGDPARAASALRTPPATVDHDFPVPVACDKFPCFRDFPYDVNRPHPKNTPAPPTQPNSTPTPVPAPQPSGTRDGLVGMPNIRDGNITGDTIVPFNASRIVGAPKGYTVVTLHEHDDGDNDHGNDDERVMQSLYFKDGEHHTLVTCKYVPGDFCHTPIPIAKSAHKPKPSPTHRRHP